MSEKKELNPSPKFPSGDYPKLSPNPNQVDGLVNKTSEKPNTQFVNLPKEQEKRCLTVSEVIALIQKYAPKGDTLPEVTSADNKKVLEVIAGAWAKGRKKVSIIDAPTGAHLNAEQLAAVQEGTFFDGVVNFAAGEKLKSPVYFPSNAYAGVLPSGGIIGQSNDAQKFYIGNYIINTNAENLNEFYPILEYEVGYRIAHLYRINTINSRTKPQVEIELTNLGTITSTETATGSGFYKNEIPYTGGIENEDVINVKMSNGAVYQAINDTTNSKLVIYTGVDFASNSISVSKCWKLAY